MLIQVVKNQSMQAFLKMLENQSASNMYTVLQCRFSLQPHLLPNQDDLVLALKDFIGDFHSSIYFCHDHDILISWRGGSKKTLTQVKESLMKAFPEAKEALGDNDLFRYYDYRAHGEELRILCRNKIKSEKEEAQREKENQETEKELARLEKESKKADKKFVVRILDKKYIQVDDEFYNAFNTTKVIRGKRRRPTFLIVEDQKFAGQMLGRILEEFGDCKYAQNGQEGLLLYALNVPDIVFLDINLPDASGHQLGHFIRQFDPDAYMIMVTANHKESDIEKAKENKVQGYVAKPYTLKKIQELMETYQRKTGRKKSNAR